MKWIFFFAIIYTWLLCGCNNCDNDFSYKTSYINDTTLVYNIQHKNGAKFNLGFYQNGNILYFSNMVNGYQQMLIFHKNGNLRSKDKIKEKGYTVGRVYTFHEESGNLSSDQEFNDSKRVGTQIYYYDKTSEDVEAIYKYDENGELYYHIEVDTLNHATVIKDTRNLAPVQ